MRPMLSVVVPFYGVEAYLGECLESLRTQTLRDLEVILVDDGSPDGSAEIAKDYAARDPRFVLVQQENRGLGPARNAGAEVARGRYLAFADSDDIVARNGYELLVGALEASGSDIASGDVARFDAVVRPGPSPADRGVVVIGQRYLRKNCETSWQPDKYSAPWRKSRPLPGPSAACRAGRDRPLPRVCWKEPRQHC